MGDRFYTQQLQALGNCPGNKNPNRRSRKVAWDDDKKAEAVRLYEAAEPTPETSMEIVKDVAEELDESPNGKPPPLNLVVELQVEVLQVLAYLKLPQLMRS